MSPTKASPISSTAPIRPCTAPKETGATAFRSSSPTIRPDAAATPVYRFLTRPTPTQIAQITRLYREAGWWPENVEDPVAVARIVAGSHCFAVALLEGRIVGMGRAISDRASDGYIQDVTVLASRRGRGIGRRIVQGLIRRLTRDGIGWIGLIAENDTHPFYRPLGFEPMSDAVPLLLTVPDRLPGNRPTSDKP